MTDNVSLVARELEVRTEQVRATADLLDGGGTLASLWSHRGHGWLGGSTEVS